MLTLLTAAVLSALTAMALCAWELRQAWEMTQKGGK